MRFTTVRTDGTTRAARVEGDELVLLDHADVGALLRSGDDGTGTGPTVAAATADRAPLVIHPEKIVCVGVNYRDHIEEMGREPPAAPTYFAKYRRALIGARDDIALPDPAVSTSIDWEAELAVVIGTEVRDATATEALEAIAGYSVLNDVSVRDYQRRTTQFLAGKTWEGMTPLGPELVTRDELGDGSGLAIRCEVDGVVKQESTTSELVFNAVDIVADLSRVITLAPGDVIATGTPGGVGAARTPPEFMTEGTELRTVIEGIGECLNVCRFR
ncbi:MAG: fumarylacetoacetate hydrolase family protein [Acidimicrobiales bacterium]|nr:fumarylacetoacetate hydrolase family protein [Acidimicrobiales bacterium]